MKTLTREICRIEIDPSEGQLNIRDKITNSTPDINRAVDMVFQLGFVWDNSQMVDISDYSSIRVEVKNERDPSASAVMAKTILAADFSGNASITKEQWDAGTHQHAEVGFSKVETALNLSGSSEKSFWLIVKVTTSVATGSKEFILGTQKLVVKETGYSSGVESPGSGSFATLALTSGTQTLNAPFGHRNVTLSMASRTQTIVLNGGVSGYLLRLYVKWLSDDIELSIQSSSSEVFNYTASSGSEAMLEFVYDGGWVPAGPNLVAVPDAPLIEPDEPAADTSFIAANSILWMRASKLARSGVVDGERVASWTDDSPSNIPATQSELSQRPKLKAASVNGYSSVLFDGVDDYLTHESLFLGAGARTICAVYKATDKIDGDNVNSIAGQSGETGEGMWSVIQSRDWGGAVGDPYFAGYEADVTDGSAPDGLVKLAVFTYDGTTARLRKNGAEISSGALSLNTNESSFLIGADDTDGGIGEFLKGEIAEIIVFGSALSGSNLTAVESYLMAKYGL